MPQEEPEIIGNITDIETIAVNISIRDLPRLRHEYGGNRWRKLKGRAYVIEEGRPLLAEVHWYECSGIGRREMRVKFYLED
jgi:hypothetical protein